MLDLTLNEIYDIKDKELRDKYFTKFLQELKTNGLSLDEIDHNSTVTEIILAIYEEEALREYENYFLGHNQDDYKFYAWQERRRSKENCICDLCSEKIYKGSFYIYYKPMIYNRKNKETLVMEKAIKSKESCKNHLPESYYELMLLFDNIDRYYDNPIDEESLFPNYMPLNGNNVSFAEASRNINAKMKRLVKK